MTSPPTTNHTHINFTPNPAQERCLRTMRPGDRIFWRSGVGTGKTNMIAFIGQRLAHLNPNTPGLIVSHNLIHVQTEIIDPLIGYLQQAGTYAGKNLYLRRLYLCNGAMVQWAGAHKPSSIDGKNVGWGLADEIRYWPEDSYTKFVSRIRKPCPWGFEGIFTTPELNWIARKFKNNPDFKEIVAKTSENAANLQPGFYERLAASLSPELYESYVNGEWMHTGGGVFPEFRQETHVPEHSDLYHPREPVHVGYDPGVQKSAAVFFQHHRWCYQHRVENCIHVLDEMMLDDTPTQHAAGQWRGLYFRHGWSQGTVYLDPAGRARSTSTGMSDVTVLRECGWDCKWTTDRVKRNVVAGVQLIRGKLKPYQGEPSLFFHPRLTQDATERGILRAIMESRYKDPSGSDRDDEPIKDGKLDHARDSLRYPIVNLCPMPATSFIRPATRSV